MSKSGAPGRRVLALVLALVGASAAHWLLTPVAHPDASAREYSLAILQMLGGFGAALWLVLRERRHGRSTGPQQSSRPGRPEPPGRRVR